MFLVGTLIDGEPILKLPPKSICLKKVDFSHEEREFYLKLEADSRQQFKVLSIIEICFIQEEKRKMVSTAFGEDQTSSHATRLTVEDLRRLFNCFDD
ncbi:hypothetical protein B296_00048200 [Ensete ventricosum]|uniref:Uncharacterized protein n=1 Tax=Ensete ventricosum TaxID=4639 RepID=A0A426YH11_ENSVE|nr:hypothetical protein B296_00048200 [Ensete ventricosum]